LLVLCDFDGTITEVDATDIVWSTRIDPHERGRMVNEVNQKRWNMQIRVELACDASDTQDSWIRGLALLSGFLMPWCSGLGSMRQAFR
jgi:phosphoserine phosphatase